MVPVSAEIRPDKSLRFKWMTCKALRLNILRRNFGTVLKGKQDSAEISPMLNILRTQGEGRGVTNR
jgi:hypothetical protein